MVVVVEGKGLPQGDMAMGGRARLDPRFMLCNNLCICVLNKNIKVRSQFSKSGFIIYDFKKNTDSLRNS